MTKQAQEIAAGIAAASPGGQENAARQRLLSAVETLTARAGIPPPDTAPRRPEYRQAQDLEILATLAKAMVALTERNENGGMS